MSGLPVTGFMILALAAFVVIVSGGSLVRKRRARDAARDRDRDR
jgi:adenylate kinase